MLSCASPFNSSSSSRKKPAGFLSRLKVSLALVDEWKNKTSYDSDGSQPSPAMAVHLPVGDLAIAIQPWLLQLRGFLSDYRARTIGILGPGGVGKTTILKALNNEILGRSSSNKKHKFHLVIFAPVSRDSNLKRLQAIIARRLNLPCRENESKEITAIRISMALRGRRFLLLLDDLQQSLHLQEIGIPLPDGQNKCMLIFTTRSESVCNKMNADKVLVVEPLDSEGSLQLFRRCAGEEASSPEIIDVAKSFASKCGGLALALITVGRSLASTKQTKEEWTRCLEIFNHVKEKLSSIRGMDQSTTLLFSSFYFSYTMLGIGQRNCLLYCSLYPKNYSINIEELIRYWMGEGLFLKEQDCIDGARTEGSKIITKLKSLGMLEDGDSPDSEVFMHDIMHDLALSIIKKEFVVQAHDAGQEEDLVKVNTNMVSLMNNNTIEMLDQLPAACPHLQSLILRRNGEIKHDSSLIFRSSSSSLGLLDLSHTRVRKIPSEIGSLVSLRYLDLSFTKIKVLPQEIGNLVNLVQLLLEGTSSLASIPGGIIPKLTKIVALNLYASFGDWGVTAKATDPSGDSTAESAATSIEELKCLKQLNELGITICNTQALEDFVDSSGLTESTRYLFVNECEDLKNLHLSKSSFEKLQRVTIADCGALEKLIIGGNNNSSDDREDGGDLRLSSLETIRLKALYKAEIIWKGVSNYSDCLPKLREVDISFCHELRNVSWVLGLGCLERIKLDSCKRIEHVVEPGGSTEGKFPRLETMTLRNLPRLKSISNHPLSFSLLESVKVLGCPQLRTLPERTDSDSNPVFISGEKEWWNALKWSSDEKQRPSFWYFRATKENY